MAKQVWKAGNMVYPLPAVMVSTADKEGQSEASGDYCEGVKKVRGYDYGDGLQDAGDPESAGITE